MQIAKGGYFNTESDLIQIRDHRYNYTLSAFVLVAMKIVRYRVSYETSKYRSIVI